MKRPFRFDAMIWSELRNRDAARVRRCEHPGCEEEGRYRAPRSRCALDSYYWFCLDHVRAYNAAWNYYAGMSEGEVEQELRSDTFWHRPSWPFGGASRMDGRPFQDPHGLFRDAPYRNGAPHEGERAQATTAEMRALAILELRPPIDVDMLKRRYKELVKRHHPDANGGDRASEERLKAINTAYTALMEAFGA